jgi:hypothetical protein
MLKSHNLFEVERFLEPQPSASYISDLVRIRSFLFLAAAAAATTAATAAVRIRVWITVQLPRPVRTRIWSTTQLPGPPGMNLIRNHV